MRLLTKRRKKLGLSQMQMATLLGTVQSEVSKTENGEMPTDVKRWAKAYRTTVKTFKTECETAIFPLPLWEYFVESPWQIEHIECKARVNMNRGVNPAVLAILELDAKGRHIEADQVAILYSEMEEIA